MPREQKWHYFLSEKRLNGADFHQPISGPRPRHRTSIESLLTKVAAIRRLWRLDEQFAMDVLVLFLIMTRFPLANELEFCSPLGDIDSGSLVESRGI